METRSQLVTYAKQIAIHQGYTNLVNGLQPVADLEAKYQHELNVEFADALTFKDYLHQLHEAADLLYYAACLRVQSYGGEHWYSTARSTITYTGIDIHDAGKAALAKYAWRAEKPGNKDEVHELQLIEAAIAEGEGDDNHIIDPQ